VMRDSSNTFREHKPQIPPSEAVGPSLEGFHVGVDLLDGSLEFCDIRRRFHEPAGKIAKA